MKARQIAMGGVFAALGVVLMLVGGIIPIGTYAAPMFASLLLIFLLREMPTQMCVGWYFVVSILSGLLCPDRETAFVFIVLGWYPICRPRLERLRPILRVILKLLIFNAAIGVLYAILVFLFQLEAVVQEFSQTAPIWIVLLLVLGNVTFLIYDLVLGRLTRLLLRKNR